MNEFANMLIEKAEKAGLPLEQEQAERFSHYYELLLDWNTRMNLTAITDPGGVIVRHFIDSLLLTRMVEIPENAQLADIGTGAGFPSVPVGIVRPDVKLLLVDSLNKRITFLKQLTAELGVRAECIHSRAEELGKKPEYRESCEVVTARAVAHLRELAEYCLPFVRPGGVFAAMKGPDLQQELEEAKKAIQLLGGQVEELKEYQLPDGSGRSLLLVRKISQTPTKYPRPSAKIAKSPLK